MPAKSILISLLGILFMAMVPGRGHLSFDASFLDIGTIKRGEVKNYSFDFTNTGEKKVKISSVVAARDCLQVSLKDSVIDIDQSSTIKVTFDTEKHKAGDFAFAVTVNSNADNKEVKLKLFGVLQ